MATSPETPETTTPELVSPEATETAEATPAPTYSYVKLAMRNMVRKKWQSLRHFSLTVIGLLTLLIGLSYLTKP